MTLLPLAHKSPRGENDYFACLYDAATGCFASPPSRAPTVPSGLVPFFPGFHRTAQFFQCSRLSRCGGSSTMSRFVTRFVLPLAGLAGLLVAAPAFAHTTQICWKDVNGVTTFYAGTYHGGTTPTGKIIIDGFGYPFSGSIPKASLPAGVSCWTCPNGGPAVVRYQTFTSAFLPASHSISFDATTVIQAPYCTFPNQTFGGGACADADFDGLCNNDDACPLDAANDGDKDGKCGNVDNCPTTYNPDQKDANANGQGDVCEGIVCGNGLQQGTEECDDGNKAGGDGCSAICTLEAKDADNDGIADNADNCPTIANANQANNDGDSQGDVCDADDDNDGVVDVTDNCSLVSNSDQANNDGDSQGDICDADDDNDGVPDTSDNCPTTANSTQANGDGDSQGDVCDGDDDNDGVPDTMDNCYAAPNTDQADLDLDGQGDACDDDDDGDGAADTVDNCPTIANDQTDLDLDSLGDACDDDDDGDTVLDVSDNCPLKVNSDQANNDSDAQGDVCDADDDNDGVADTGACGIPVSGCSAVVCNGYNFSGGCLTLGAGAHEFPVLNEVVGNDNTHSVQVLGGATVELWEHHTPYGGNTFNGGHATYTASSGNIDGDGINGVSSVAVFCGTTCVANDNCPLVANADQVNTDGDSLGNACDDDDDNDSIADSADNCSLVANADQVNTDGDELGDACDPDLDGDGVSNTLDNCVAAVNADQANLDGDSEGDVCDGDDDGDAVLDGLDNCPMNANADQGDQDGDGLGDACDPDIDGDGVANGSDNCVTTVNGDQVNNDGDSQGDACDADDDNDGVVDTGDNCHFVANSSQANFDGDAQGDACDADDDNDNVLDGKDSCASTVLGAAVDPASGCSVAQLCPCSGPRGQSVAWKNHGAFASCTAHSLNSLVKLGVLTEQQKGSMQSAAAQSGCGKK